MGNVLENVFRIKERGSSISKEFLAGLTTFMTMSYIIFVQPAVLESAGINFDAGLLATVLASAIACVVMGLLANYPIALAPGMGENFFFSYTLVPMLVGILHDKTLAWQTALALVFMSGALFAILSVVKLREAVIDAMPESLKNAIAVGIGIFIALIGLVDSGIITFNTPSHLPTLGDFSNPSVLLAIFGVLLISVLLALRVYGAILWGMLVTALVGVIFGVIQPPAGIIGFPKLEHHAILALNFSKVLNLQLVIPVLILLYMDLFDTVGTLIGVGNAAGLLKDGKLENADKALLSDAIGTMVGALVGTSTVTSYIESASGVEVGGRTGLTAIFVALFFLISLIFYPIIKMIASPVVFKDAQFYPVTAPALILVGSLMLRPVRNINWDDITEAIPAFITILSIPLTYNIAHGIALGFISYVLVKVFSGRWKDISWLTLSLAVIFIIRYVYYAIAGK